MAESIQNSQIQRTLSVHSLEHSTDSNNVDQGQVGSKKHRLKSALGKVGQFFARIIDAFESPVALCRFVIDIRNIVLKSIHSRKIETLESDEPFEIRHMPQEPDPNQAAKMAEKATKEFVDSEEQFMTTELLEEDNATKEFVDSEEQFMTTELLEEDVEEDVEEEIKVKKGGFWADNFIFY